MNRLFFLLTLISLSGCDCLQLVKGTVVDAATGDPIANAVIYKDADNAVRDTTDMEGAFEISDITGARNCGNVTLIVERIGYNDLIITAPNNEDIVIQMSN
jgi:hypothetical protein